MPRFGSGRRIGLLVAASLGGFCTSALAQDTANGERIAKTWCAGCHVVEGRVPPVGRTDVIPSFSAVAHMKSTTATSLRIFLGTPHTNMPDYNLTPQEIKDVSAYILTLRD
jgi:mono/diheme cytochrome c family protein